MISKLRKHAAALWCSLFIASVIGFTIERSVFVQAFTSQEHYRYLVIGPDSYFLPKSFGFEDAQELHFENAQIACELLFERKPSGVKDSSQMKRLERVFMPEAYRKARQYIESEATDFQDRSIYQQVDISEIQQLMMVGDSVLVQVSGQLVRTGEFMGKPFREGLEFVCRIRFVANRSVLENGRTPIVVSDFNLKTKPIESV
ncbi:MAG: hypothetical protein ACPGN3_15940 [Opitutales bacterium]